MTTELLSYKSFVKAISGAAGGTFSLSVFYPLDLLRTKLQVGQLKPDRSVIKLLAQIVRQNGFWGLYQGIGPNLVALGVSNFVYFYTFHGLKHLWPLALQDAMKDSAFAYIAGTINVLLTTPLWMSAVRIKLQQNFKDREDNQLVAYKGLADCLSGVYRTEGIPGLWRGTIASLLLVFNPSIQFTIYEALKRYYLSLFQLGFISGPMAFLIGALSKFIATIITYPLQVVQSRQRSGRNAKPQSSFRVLMEVLRTSGFRGMFHGLEAKLWQTVLTAALMFVTYEKLTELIFSLLKTT